MLRELKIKNIVLIEHLNIVFKSGLSVLTGETGTGKSILLDSLGLILGNRSDFSLIRKHAEFASVTGVFDIPVNHPVKTILDKYNIVNDAEIIIRRELKKEGKSKCIINDTLVTRNTLIEVTDQIIEIQGQFEDRGLLNVSSHLSLLDSFAKHEDLITDTKNAYNNVIKYKKLIDEAEIEYNRNNTNSSWIKDSLEQLNSLNPEQHEEESLSLKKTTLVNQDKILSSINNCKKIIEREDGLEDLLNQLVKNIDSISSYGDTSLLDAAEVVNRSSIEINEIKNMINNESLKISEDNQSLEMIDDRLYELRSQARKHNCKVEELPIIIQSLNLELETLSNNEKLSVELKRKYNDSINEYNKSSDILSLSRKKAAVILSSKINKELPHLKLENAKIEIFIENFTDGKRSIQGNDKVIFLACTNSGMDMNPINKIVSGGELSRFLLAIKFVLETSIQNRTIIFDEIDSGIGGSVANAVGVRLAKLGQAYQTIIVTHSPQVTSKGIQHYLIEKNIINNITQTKVTQLFGKDRIEEIARMLSGDTITNEAREAASRLIDENLSCH